MPQLTIRGAVCSVTVSQVVGHGPPSGGGATMAEALQILAGIDFGSYTRNKFPFVSTYDSPS